MENQNSGSECPKCGTWHNNNDELCDECEYNELLRLRIKIRDR